MSAMITFDVALATADLTDPTDRLILADVLTDLGRDDEAAILRDESRDARVIDGRVRTIITALDYANGREDIIVRYAGPGQPAGDEMPLLPDSELPFDLDTIEGYVGEDGQFQAIDCPGLHEARDWRNNSIWAVWLRSDAEAWKRQAVAVWQEVGVMYEVFGEADWSVVEHLDGYIARVYGDDGDEPGECEVVLESADLYGITVYRWAARDDSGTFDRGNVTLDREEASQAGRDFASDNNEE